MTHSRILSSLFLFSITLVFSAFSIPAIANLVTIEQQYIEHRKIFIFSNFTNHNSIAGEEVIQVPDLDVHHYSNAWTDSLSYSNVSMEGSSSIAYSFVNNEFTYSSSTSTSLLGTTSEAITAHSAGRAEMRTIFTLNQAATAFFDLSLITEKNGSGGNGGIPLADGQLLKVVGIDPRYGNDIYDGVFDKLSTDLTIGDGPSAINFSDSIRLDPGRYSIGSFGSAHSLYHQPQATSSDSSQFSSVDMSLRFEAIPSVAQPSTIGLFLVATLLLLLRSVKT